MNWFIQILNLLPSLIVIAVFVLAVIFSLARKPISILIWAMVVFYFAVALTTSVAQYWVWSHDQFSQLLLNLPLDKTIPGWLAQLPIFTEFSFGYFLFYAWNHFWLREILSVVAAFGIYKIFWFLRRINERFLGDREVSFGFLMALLIGWPQVLFFLPLVFITAVIFSVFSKVYQRKDICISLIWPFFISTVISMVFHDKLAKLLFLVFKI